MFREARIGDKVWSVRFGWGHIEDLGAPWKTPGQFGVKFQNDQYRNYYPDGKQSGDDRNQTLFWDEVKITPPPRPKRKVKKVIEGWIQLFMGTDCMAPGGLAQSTIVFERKSDVEEHKRRIFRGKTDWLGGPIFIRHEYEEEE